MESNFNNRDFERFVKQNADQYRMFPSEKVWEGVHAVLHTRRRRWFGVWLSLLLITASVVTWVMLLPGNKEPQQVYAPANPAAEKITDAPVTKTPNISATGPVRPKENLGSFNGTPDGLQQNFLAFNPETPVGNTASGDQELADNNNTIIANYPIALTPGSPQQPIVTGMMKQQNIFQPVNKEQAPAAVTSSPLMPPPASALVTVDQPVVAKSNSTEKSIVADDLKLPLITDRIVKTNNKNSRKKSLGWDLYITPTISYRTLSENIDFISAARYNNAVNAVGGSAAYYSSDINTMVNHRPDLGFQLGVRAAYPLSKWFSITGGFQFSVSKYNIKAYHHPAEVATIALMDRSVSTVSNYRNTNGYNENWLRNFYFTASIPVGVELKLSDGSKNYFGIAGTLQPTYVLDNRAYLISADYKNYAEMPSLTRKWNLNTSFEVFSAHTTGKVHWRVGPQVRYQVMSSFVKNYPIKENLFDFGLKLGIQLK